MKFLKLRDLVLLVLIAGISLAIYIIMFYVFFYKHTVNHDCFVFFTLFIVIFDLVECLYFIEEIKINKKNATKTKTDIPDNNKL